LTQLLQELWPINREKVHTLMAITDHLQSCLTTLFKDLRLATLNMLLIVPPNVLGQRRKNENSFPVLKQLHIVEYT